MQVQKTYQQNHYLIMTSSDHQTSQYHVFLSFRGEDTRKTFTDHLYTALINAELQTFRDDVSIRRGEDVSSELETAIRQSMSSIIVFSKDYASSRSCLEELRLILECKRNTKHVVLPVFYDVAPSEVRGLSGDFGKGFQRLEEKYSKAEVDKWRAALKEAAGLAGLVLENEEDGHESKFIQKIVKLIGQKLQLVLSLLNSQLIGVESTATSLKQWLKGETSSVGIAAILYGMVGIGKTSIARFVYQSHLQYFDGGFFQNIRDWSGRPSGLVHLQKVLLSEISKMTGKRIQNANDNILKIRDTLSYKKILLVLDDVDGIDQIDPFFEMRNRFHPDSKIIITTRNGHFARICKSYTRHGLGIPNVTVLAHPFCKIYNVKELDQYDSLRLFSWYAFGQDYPIAEYAAVCMMIVNYCGGLPLALKILGASLRGKSIDVWRSTAKRQQVIPNNHIMNQLKISFESLQDDHDRESFLLIACFFVGSDKDRVITILDACGFYAAAGLDNLIDNCLLSIDEHNKLRMHRLHRDMGRDIARRESSIYPGHRSLLWHYRDCFEVLREKSGTERIKAFSLGHMNEAQANCESDPDGNHDSDTARCSGENKTQFEVDAFRGMSQLAILQLKDVHLNGSYETFPKKLKCLSWEGFPLESIPDSLPLESVVAIEMRYSCLKQFSSQSKLLGSLKILDLSHSHALACTPDFSLLPSVEILDFEDCTSLVEIHESIGCLRKLLVLNLKNCKNLESLPMSIDFLKSLKTLDISGCVNIKTLAHLRESKLLKVVHRDGLDMNQLLSPSSTTDAISQDHKGKSIPQFESIARMNQSISSSAAPQLIEDDCQEDPSKRRRPTPSGPEEQTSCLRNAPPNLSMEMILSRRLKMGHPARLTESDPHAMKTAIPLLSQVSVSISTQEKPTEWVSSSALPKTPYKQAYVDMPNGIPSSKSKGLFGMRETTPPCKMQHNVAIDSGFSKFRDVVDSNELDHLSGVNSSTLLDMCFTNLAGVTDCLKKLEMDVQSGEQEVIRLEKEMKTHKDSTDNEIEDLKRKIRTLSEEKATLERQLAHECSTGESFLASETGKALLRKAMDDHFASEAYQEELYALADKIYSETMDLARQQLQQQNLIPGETWDWIDPSCCHDE